MKMFASSAGVPTIEIMSETELDSFYGSEERRLVLYENIHAWVRYGLRRHFLLVRVIECLNTSFSNSDKELTLCQVWSIIYFSINIKQVIKECFHSCNGNIFYSFSAD